MADEDLDLDVKGGSNTTKILLIVLIVLVLLLAGGGGYYFFVVNGKADSEAEENAAAETQAVETKTALYMPLKPEFTINFADSSKARFLQLEITIMAREQDALDAVEKHMPVVQDNIINILSGKQFDELNKPEGKQKLAEEILKSIQGVVEQEIHRPGVEAVYFTSFIMQ